TTKAISTTKVHEGHELKRIVFFVTIVAFVVGWCLRSWLLVPQTQGRANIPYADARPILDTLQPDLIPAELRTLAPAERAAMWREGVSSRDGHLPALLPARQ